MPPVLTVPPVPAPPPEPFPPVHIEPPVVFVAPAWEYRHIVRRPPAEAPLDEAALNALGSEGWELVGVLTDQAGTHFYFKRSVR